MWRKRRDILKRRLLSGILACLLVATTALNTVGIISAFAGETTDKPRISYKHHGKQDVQITVLAENESFAPGAEVALKIYIQNNTDQLLTEGNLKWTGKDLEEAGFPEIEPEDWSDLDDDLEDDLGDEEDDSVSEWGIGPGGSPSDAEMGTPSNMNVESDGKRIKHIELAPGEVYETEFYGYVSEELETIKNRKISFSFSAKKEGGGHVSETKDFTYNTGMARLLPIEFEDGNTWMTNERNTMYIRTRFEGEELLDQFAPDYFEGDKATGSNAEKGTETTAVTEEAITAASEETEGPDGSEATEAEETMATETAAAEEGSETEAESRAAEEETAVEEAETSAEIKAETTVTETKETTAAVVKETGSDDDREFLDPEALDVATVSDADDEGTDPKNIRYTIETYGAKLKGITAWYEEEQSSWGETVTGVSFRVAENTKPGTYFGRVTTSIRRDGKSYETTQGFCFYVLGEGELVLKGRINGAEIEVKGPAESFPEADMLSLKVTEVSEDKQELVQTAMEQKAEESGISINKMKAVDIKIIADGEEMEPQGDVTVRFSNVELEKVTLSGELLEDAKADAEEEIEETEAAPTKFRMMRRAADSVAEETQGTATRESAEESTMAVWHLDEEAETLDDMERVIVEDNGDVVMTTDHFSIYIIVNVAGGQKTVPVTVTHYANITNYKTEKGPRDNVPLQLTEKEVTVDGKKFLYPGANADGNYESKLIEIYSPDVIELPNGGGTGIGYSILIDDLSKLALGGNYTIKNVTVTNAIYPNGKVFTQEKGGEIRLANSGNEIKIEYEKTTGSIRGDVEFHDYNVSVPGNDGDRHNVNTQDKGINDPSLVQRAGSRIGIGIKKVVEVGPPVRDNSDAAVWYSYDGKTTPGAGIVKSELDQNMIQFSSSEPGLFARSDVVVGSNIAKKYITDHQLEFKREGDTYTLSGVYQDDNQIIGDLDILKYTGSNWNKKKNLYSNLFWPLDYYESYTGKDPLFPGGSEAYGKNNDPNGNGISSFHGTTGFGNNDETRIGVYKDHNWFFGMRYDFEFTLGDYIGPLDYYFRGDDDFWLYIDGNLVKDVELGGIHSAEGAYVDLKTYLEGKNAFPKETDSEEVAKNKKNTTHRMSVFFMERGGTGSCCYMQFTLPNIVSVPSQEAKTIAKSVTKSWQDGNNEHATRPTEIFVQLLQNGVPFGATEKLSEENNWSFTWNNLPKYRYVGSDEENTYTVKEIEVPGYESVITQSGDSFLITNVETTYLKVEKKWDNSGWNDPGENPDTAIPDSIQVQLEEKVGDFGTWKSVGDPVELQADSDPALNWKYGWQDMPLYKKVGNDYKKVTYRVTEVDGEWLKTEERQDGWYEVVLSGDQNDGFVLTNSYKPENTFKKVTKVWSDEDDKFKLRPDSIQVQLKRNGKDYGETLTLNEANGWRGGWDNLPKYYYIKNGGEIEQKPYNYTVEELKNFPNEAYYGISYVPADTSDGTDVTITNTLKTAKFRVAKRIDNFQTVELDRNDLLDDEFIISVTEAAGGRNFSTGMVLNHAANSDEEVPDSGKVSKYIRVPVTDEGIVYHISEIVPKEYTPSETFLTIINNVKDGKTVAALEGDSVRVKPDADAIVIVHNTFGHKDYFHHDASVNNDFTNGLTEDKFAPKPEAVSMLSLLPERALVVEREEERELDDDDRLM